LKLLNPPSDSCKLVCHSAPAERPGALGRQIFLTGELLLSDAQWTLLGAPWLPVENHEQCAALDLMVAEFDERSGAIEHPRALRDSMKRSTCHVDEPTARKRVAASEPDHDVTA